MKITINENCTLSEPEIIINCQTADDKILRMIAAINSCDKKITGTKNGETFLILPENILYFESVDKKTFIYTSQQVFETPLKLYEAEEKLSCEGFFRASKATIINLSQVKSLRPDFGGKLLITINNGEKMVVSRQYSVQIKQRLGI